jgi:anti-sigma factor RsiW
VRTSRWAQACPAWRGDLAAYLVGALDPQPSAAMRRHLGTCPACEAEFKDLVPVVSWLALLAPPRAGQQPDPGGDAGRARAVG